MILTHNLSLPRHRIRKVARTKPHALDDVAGANGVTEIRLAVTANFDPPQTVRRQAPTASTLIAPSAFPISAGTVIA